MERNVAAKLVFKTVANTKVAMAIAVANDPGLRIIDRNTLQSRLTAN